jgi:CubicO group peptidase (beta-lactamase class C family)
LTLDYHQNEGELIKKDNDHTLFEIGSLTKIMTTALLANLSLDRGMSVNETIAAYLPQAFRDLSTIDHIKQLIFKQLASHRSGLPRDPLKAKHYLKDSANPWSLYDIDELRYDLVNHRWPKRAKTKYQYSNVGYALLGLLLEDLGNDNFESLLTTRIMHPAKMTRSFLSNGRNMSRSAVRGYQVKGQLASNWSFDVAAPAEGVVSCTADLANFLIWTMDPNNEAALMCQQPISKGLINGTLFSYIGLGWNIIDTSLFKRYSFIDELLWHNGATAGFQSYIGFLKGKKIGVVVLTNFRSKRQHAIQLGEFILNQMNR